jgi:hypothetical protein
VTPAPPARHSLDARRRGPRPGLGAPPRSERRSGTACHEQEILELHLADVTLPQTGLDGDHVVGDELVIAHLTEGRILMDLEPNAVAERELKALVPVLPRAGSLSPMPGQLEHLASEGMETRLRLSQTTTSRGAGGETRRPARLAEARTLPQASGGATPCKASLASDARLQRDGA